MGCTYVKEFDFKKTPGDMSAAKSGYCDGGMVKKPAYARGGAVQSPGFKGQTMIADKSKLGISGNKNPGIKGSKPVAPDLPAQKLARGGPARRAMPVASREPMIAMKKGGTSKC
jgi:hypothetical protein